MGMRVPGSLLYRVNDVARNRVYRWAVGENGRG